MDTLTDRQRSQIVLWDNELKNYSAVVRKVRRLWRVRISVNGMKGLCQRFSLTANVNSQSNQSRRGLPNRRRTVRTPANEVRLMVDVAADPRASQRRRALAMQISKTSLQRMLRVNIYFFV